MDAMIASQQISRYGFYYYPDTSHYRENDLHSWLPELKALGSSWITLLAPTDRAIPDSFILPLISERIQPIIHMPLSTTGEAYLSELNVIFEAYSHWGIKYIVLFDRPNLQKYWSSTYWAQMNLVERFLDLFIPIAEAALKAGLSPVFPALEPGGDYWDTAFLQSSLQGLQRRNESVLLDHLVLSAYAWSSNRSPNWGAGGPERWPRTRPYSTPVNSEDHLGFRIFDWYLAISQAELGKRLPIILLGAGSRIGDQQDQQAPSVDIYAHTWQNFTLARIMSEKALEYDPIPPEIITANFWLLTASENDSHIKDAWFQPGQEPLPIVAKLKEWVMNGDQDQSYNSKSLFSPSHTIRGFRPIEHYLLLPTLELGSMDFHLDAIRPFITKYQPTIGFSPVEASHAKKVTVLGGSSRIPVSIIDGLLAAGCIVEQINGDGMNIATDSASL